MILGLHGQLLIKGNEMNMYKVILTWARTETEEIIFETKEEAEQYVKHIVAPGSNSYATIIEC